MPDLSRRRAQPATPDEGARSFHVIFTSAPDPIVVFDRSTLRFLDVNDAMVAKYGYSRDELCSMLVTDIRLEDDPDQFRTTLRALTEEAQIAAACRHRLRDGRIIEVDVTSRLVGGADADAVLALQHDVTVERELERRLRHQALHDPLTGLANRALFSDRVGHAIERRVPGRGLAVALLDLDHFKAVNHSLGRQAGDRLISAVATRLAGRLRAGDVMARVGGDEFAVILDELAGDTSARRTAQRLLTALQAPFDVDGVAIAVTASLGLVMAGAGASAEDVLRDAEAAMYTAKARGPGEMVVFDDGMRKTALRRHSLAQDLRKAVARRELHAAYQLQVDTTTGRIVGVEALARWKHPTNGSISPDEFIPLAEQTGIVWDIDSWVLRTACGQVRAWERAGLGALRLAVNISGRDLCMAGLPGEVRRILDITGLPAERLELELTESVTVHPRDRGIEVLRQVRALGVRIAIDDFGTGYSVLSRLRDFPVDRLKIDRSFVTGILHDHDKAPLVTAMIAMARGLGLTVVAEGVETAAQAHFLKGQGCDELQGYLIARPCGAAAMGRMLRSSAATTLRAATLPPARAPLAVARDERGVEHVIRILLEEAARLTGHTAAAHGSRAGEPRARVDLAG